MAILFLLGRSTVLRSARSREGRWRGSRRPSRMRCRMKGRLWVSREGGGEGDGGDTVYSVKSEVGLSSHSPAAKELGN